MRWECPRAGPRGGAAPMQAVPRACGEKPSGAEVGGTGGEDPYGGAGFVARRAELCHSACQPQSCAASQSPGRDAPGEEGEGTPRWLRRDSQGLPSSPLLSLWEAP